MVAVLAGRANTRLVAALVAAGVPAVGLTGADARLVRVRPMGPYRATDGRLVDLGRVGRPQVASIELVATLWRHRYVPVVASLALGPAGRLFNVNADTLAAFLAARVGARRLVLAGTTRGVLDQTGRTIPRIAASDIDDLARAGRVTKGMIAKLHACRAALAAGVSEVAIVDGRALTRLDRLVGTLVVADEPRRLAPRAAAAATGQRPEVERIRRRGHDRAERLARAAHSMAAGRRVVSAMKGQADER